MKTFIGVMILFLSSIGLFAADAFRIGGGITPGIAVLRSRTAGSDNNSDKSIPAGVLLSFSFSLSDSIGLGTDLTFAPVSRLVISDDDSSIVLDNWDGALFYLNLSFLIFYRPEGFDDVDLLFGLGPAYTGSLYISQNAFDLEEHYLGIALKMHLGIPLTDQMDIALGWRTTVDFLGFWNASPIFDFTKIHFFPSLTVGYRF